MVGVEEQLYKSSELGLISCKALLEHDLHKEGPPSQLLRVTCMQLEAFASNRSVTRRRLRSPCSPCPAPRFGQLLWPYQVGEVTASVAYGPNYANDLDMSRLS